MHTAFVFFQLLYFDLFNAIKFIPDVNTDIITKNGISVKISPSNVNTTTTKWIVNPISSISYDISVEISNQYGFSAAIASTISIEIDGFSPNDSRIGGEILILFSTDNYQYFSVVINLENNVAWKSYPNYENNPLATNMDVITNIINNNNTRWNRISNNNQWTNIGGATPHTRDLRWPLNMNITNDPINNKLYFKCIEPKNTLIQTTFDTAFDTNKGLNIYIMNNEIGTNKPFYIYSFDIISSHMYNTSQISSSNPSNTPTFAPTIKTSQPSLSPTTQPTVSPTFQPSLEPTIQPTISPTFQPSLSPTVQPTISPTYQPSLSPTIQLNVSPTSQQSLLPTFQPTISPSLLPTIQPTVSPTSQPTTLIQTTIHANTLSPTVIPTTSTYKPSIGSAEITEFVTDSTVEINKFESNKMQINILIYIIIAGVAVLCFTSGIVISVVIYKRKINEINTKDPYVTNIHINNDESAFKLNKFVNPELTQQQNELQVEMHRIMFGNDEKEEVITKYKDDDAKLIIEDAVTNVFIVKNGLVERDSDNEVVDKLPTIESIHGHVVNTKRKSSHLEGNVNIHHGKTKFIDR